jgi:outer membrane biosynthesis protein TonB
MSFTICLSLFIIFIQLPEISRKAQEELPPQFAELILKKKESPVPKISKPEKQKKKKEPKKKKKPKKPKAEPKPVKKVVKKVKKKPAPQTARQAREKAQVSGLLAFKDDFAEMREQLDIGSLNDTSAIKRGTGKKARLDRSLLTAKDGKRQAAVNVANLSRDTGGVALAGRSTTRVDAPAEEQATAASTVRSVNRSKKSERSIEKVRKVFDANKGAIYAIYNRALRKNPDLLGKIVLELIIEPDGRVSDCRVVSTELNDKKMVAKLVRRVQLFDFGERDVAVTKISYPVHFLPS